MTALDRAVEAAWRGEITRFAPEHEIIGEEYGAEKEDRDWVWILDPIGGARRFAAGLVHFGKLIALCHRRRPLICVISHPRTGMTCIDVAR